MSLLSKREKAKHRLDMSVKTLLETHDIDGKIKAPHKREWDKANAISAKNQLYKLERELSKIKNHAGHPKVEMYARLMLVFRPELKCEVEELVTFT